MAQYIRQQDQEEVERPGSPTSEVLLIILLMFTFSLRSSSWSPQNLLCGISDPTEPSPQGKDLNSKPIFKFPQSLQVILIMGKIMCFAKKKLLKLLKLRKSNQASFQLHKRLTCSIQLFNIFKTIQNNFNNCINQNKSLQFCEEELKIVESSVKVLADSAGGGSAVLFVSPSLK